MVAARMWACRVAAACGVALTAMPGARAQPPAPPPASFDGQPRPAGLDGQPRPAGLDGQPRLAGIVIGPGGRVAILAHDRNGTWITLAEGEADGPFRVQSIAPDSIVLAGPAGAIVLRPEERGGSRPAPPPPIGAASDAEPAATALGARVGAVARRYDACVRQGLLPAVGEPAAARLEAVLDAMANMPAHDAPPAGETAAPPVPPPAEMSAWTRAGVRSARAGAEPGADAASCAQATRDWQAAAREIGAR